MRLFAEGLAHLTRDEFEPAIERLEQGIALNTDNPPVNDDMRLAIAEIRGKLAGQPATRDPVEEPLSSAQMLLRQFSRKSTRH